MDEMTTSQAASRLGVGASTVRLWCQQGRFPNARAEATPRGVVWLIPRKDIDVFDRPKRGRIPNAAQATHAPEKRVTGAARASNGTATGKQKGGKK